MHVGLVHILIVIGFPESLAVHFAERLGRLLQSWILTFYSILAPKMVRISDPKLLRWVESSNSPTWFDDFPHISYSCLLPQGKS